MQGSYNISAILSVPFYDEVLFLQLGFGAYVYTHTKDLVEVDNSTYFGTSITFGFDISIVAELYFTFFTRVDIIIANEVMVPYSGGGGLTYRFHI